MSTSAASCPGSHHVRPRGRTSEEHPARSRHLCLLIALGSAMLCALCLPSSAHAHKRNFVWSYEWFTPYLGERETEIWLNADGEGPWKPWLEYEFAPGDHQAMGLYLTFEGATLNGWKLENRRQFSEFALNKWLHAAYLELKKETGGAHEVEAKWLLSRYVGDDEATAINLVAEKPLAAGGEVEWEITSGWSKLVRPRLRIGAEAVAKFTDMEWYLGPTISYDVSGHHRVLAGLGKGLTHDSHDLIVRVISEYEW